MFACDNVWLWSWLFVVLSEPTSQTFFGWLNHSGGSCSAAAREAAAVGRGWRQQGTVQNKWLILACCPSLCSMSNESIVAVWFTICTILDDFAMLTSAAAQPELSEEEAGARQLREKGCLIASCMDDMCNWDEASFLVYNMSNNCKDNGLFRIMSNWVLVKHSGSLRSPMKYRTTWTCLPAIMFGYGHGCLLFYRSSLLRHSLVG